jgi:dihydroorotate dehydrogenase (fumarate)
MSALTKTSIAGVAFDSYVCNASGPRCSTLEELETIARSGSSAIMMKSCTIEARAGNEEPRYANLPHGAIQSMGLPNLGYREYVRFAAILKEKYPDKPIIASVSGLKPADYPIMVRAFQESAVDLIEANLSCPNIPGKPQIAYDTETTEMILSEISGLGTKPLGIKLPPFYDPAHHAVIAELVKKYGIRFVSCINSIGNTLVIDPETEMPVIRPKRGLGGLSGSYIKPVALANVRIFHELLQGTGVSIFGVGGVMTGTDAFEFLLAGADAVQIATVFEQEGPDCFARIDRELAELLERKGYASIEAARGKLKYL